MFYFITTWRNSFITIIKFNVNGRRKHIVIFRYIPDKIACLSFSLWFKAEKHIASDPEFCGYRTRKICFKFRVYKSGTFCCFYIYKIRLLGKNIPVYITLPWWNIHTSHTTVIRLVWYKPTIWIKYYSCTECKYKCYDHNKNYS